ncbi:Speckle-type POZ protein-like B [Tetrabaena socialis]|uniref:Speckle-type POZ protein-like B n=1 Tax=Tetrabaena socialis TaxID=47790 RepID=A0A2J7ZS17_9CHLO|nr:Speckle-type POZ protein-like B [Tetrabaena socialis]|eukprot:PNH03062.1 Speckle-type POZ protein-like B [Tetrabaena socialis]
MHFLRCTLPASEPVKGAATRILPGARRGEAPSTQTLLACGLELRPLTGADAHGGLELGPPLQLYAHPAARGGNPAAAQRPFLYPVWDPFTSAIYMCQGHAVLRLASDDSVAVVAGDVGESGVRDGPGGAARFCAPRFLVSDCAGSLYVVEGKRIRRLQLPDVGAGRGAAQEAQATACGEPGAAAGQAVATAAVAATDLTAAAEREVLVSTLPHQASAAVWGLAFESGGGSGGSSNSSRGGGGSLLFTTDTALYRLPLADPTASPSLVAGAAADGRGQTVGAGFSSVYGIVLDSDGCVYVPDFDGGTTSLLRVAPDGAVTTIAEGLEGDLSCPSILPNGCLALFDLDQAAVHLLGLGLKLPNCHTGPAPARPLPRTLPADLGALLGRQPDGTADVTIVVGGRTFHAHRLLLCARSDYFQQRLGADFADGSAQQLDLPDADPEAFELVLLFLYSGEANVPLALAASVAELADRLLLPELCEQAAAVLEATVSVSTVVGLLLWADSRGPAFSELLTRLKGWYVEHHQAVMREAEEEVGLLMARSPKLLLELMRGLPSKQRIPY